MAMTLTAEKRTAEEKTDSLRMESLVPSILYGYDTENQTLKVKQQEFNKVFAESGTSQIVELSIDGKTYDVLVKEVQIDPLKRDVVHIDFYSVDVSKPVQVNIPIHYVGEAPAVKSSGGALMKKANSVEVECLPKNLVKYFNVDLSALKSLDDSIFIKDIELGDAFTLLSDPEGLVATVTPPRVEKAAQTVEAAPAEGEAAPAEGDAAPAEEAK